MHWYLYKTLTETHGIWFIWLIDISINNSLKIKLILKTPHGFKVPHYSENSVMSCCGFYASNQRACITLLSRKEEESFRVTSTLRCAELQKWQRRLGTREVGRSWGRGNLIRRKKMVDVSSKSTSLSHRLPCASFDLFLYLKGIYLYRECVWRRWKLSLPS